jgi:beta-glucanase (GH16 family)
MFQSPPIRVLAIPAIIFLVAAAHAEPPPGYRLAWADEFDGTQLDAKKWVHWLPGVRRHATNVPEAVTVADGMLTITTYTEGGKNFTGMIGTEKLYEARYGYWEARIDFDDAPGMWSAFWSQTPTIGDPLGDVARAGMEIDFAEHRFEDSEGKRIDGTVNHTLHWDGYGWKHRGSGKATPDWGLGGGFHVYGFEWTATEYRFFVDGKLTWTVNTPISQRTQFVILSSEVESEAWSGKIPAGGYGTRAESKTRMRVDYVRHYTKP